MDANSGNTRIIHVADEAGERPELDEAARVIEEGGLVGFPTDTVYGIAVREDDSEAVERLLDIRNSPPDKKMSVHIGEVETFYSLVSRPLPPAMRLANRFWPGPLTIVHPHPERETVGIRYPRHGIAMDLLQRVNPYVLAPSANRSGEEPATTADEVLDVFEGEIEMVIEGGEATHGVSSSVVKVGRESSEILREGAVDREEIESELAPQLLFVCTGNTDRSPMAVQLAWRILENHFNREREELEEQGIRVESAGTGVSSGTRASANSQRVMEEEYGETLEEHFSRALTPEMVMESDFIITMTPNHRETILNWLPDVEDRLYVLNADEKGIRDPEGSSHGTYRDTARQIESELKKLLPELLS